MTALIKDRTGSIPMLVVVDFDLDASRVDRTIVVPGHVQLALFDLFAPTGQYERSAWYNFRPIQDDGYFARRPGFHVAIGREILRHFFRYPKGHSSILYPKNHSCQPA